MTGEQAEEQADAARARRLTWFTARWNLSPAVAAAVVVGVVCAAAGFFASRVDLALVGIPLLVSAAIAWDRRPGEQARVGVSARVDAAGGARLTSTVEATSDAGADAVELRISLRGQPPIDAVVSRRRAERLTGTLTAGHSGPQRLVSVETRMIGADAAIVTEPTPPVTAERVVAPRVRAVRSLPLPSRLIGLTGPHDSARPGDGGEFRDVGLFAAGDRLRRIDWKATARRAQTPGELYVRRTMATSDAAIQFVIDSRDDLTGRVADWAAAYPRPGIGSQDLAREAAASLASAYAAAGDRVGFDDLADARRGIPPRSGSRHLQRVLRAVAQTGPRGIATERVRAPVLAPGALVFVLSTFLDEQALGLALVWRAAGHRVIAVDTLPDRLTSDLTPRDRVALRVVELERTLRFRRLAAGGIDVMRWQDEAGDTRGARLRELSMPRRPR
ncbi:DUF58 domain-containing protein [Leifsonia poae]|uniref:DUF58 domain-containing protein n=1 Tax=Leifsonia poae TaxID=110933 RepID=A0A9W6HCV3_9MICO|nr:DUF58 domain-containing protein [Leifsonia poae]GLJ78156.1 hypothetical protein GCM10017584_37300 [Leifsonia poae]